MKKFISYLRVSTKKQGKSGLGLDAQKETIERYVEREGGMIMEEYTEVLSGKNDKRPMLLKAINQSKKIGATIIVAKLDRLSRNVSFFFELKDAKVDFLVADLPDLNTLTLGFFATMAQYERERISQRTIDALKAAKAKGKVLGKKGYLNLSQEHRESGALARAEKARHDKNNIQVRSIIKTLREKKYNVWEIAEHLNNLSYRTATGKEFTDTSVYYHLNQMYYQTKKTTTKPKK
jgi:DNA invertase Pin-like site-specific DNA recombinase